MGCCVSVTHTSAPGQSPSKTPPSASTVTNPSPPLRIGNSSSTFLLPTTEHTATNTTTSTNGSILTAPPLFRPPATTGDGNPIVVNGSSTPQQHPQQHNGATFMASNSSSNSNSGRGGGVMTTLFPSTLTVVSNPLTGPSTPSTLNHHNPAAASSEQSLLPTMVTTTTTMSSSNRRRATTGGGGDGLNPKATPMDPHLTLSGDSFSPLPPPSIFSHRNTSTDESDLNGMTGTTNATMTGQPPSSKRSSMATVLLSTSSLGTNMSEDITATSIASTAPSSGSNVVATAPSGRNRRTSSEASVRWRQHHANTAPSSQQQLQTESELTETVNDLVLGDVMTRDSALHSSTNMNSAPLASSFRSTVMSSNGPTAPTTNSPMTTSAALSPSAVRRNMAVNLYQPTVSPERRRSSATGGEGNNNHGIRSSISPPKADLVMFRPSNGGAHVGGSSPDPLARLAAGLQGGSVRNSHSTSTSLPSPQQQQTGRNSPGASMLNSTYQHLSFQIFETTASMAISMSQNPNNQASPNTVTTATTTAAGHSGSATSGGAAAGASAGALMSTTGGNSRTTIGGGGVSILTLPGASTTVGGANLSLANQSTVTSLNTTSSSTNGTGASTASLNPPRSSGVFSASSNSSNLSGRATAAGSSLGSHHALGRQLHMSSMSITSALSAAPPSVASTRIGTGIAHNHNHLHIGGGSSEDAHLPVSPLSSYQHSEADSSRGMVAVDDVPPLALRPHSKKSSSDEEEHHHHPHTPSQRLSVNLDADAPPSVRNGMRRVHSGSDKEKLFPSQLSATQIGVMDSDHVTE